MRHGRSSENTLMMADSADGLARPASARLQVNFLFAVYILFLLEGPLRKWVLPEYQQWIYFVRDPFILASYLIAFSSGTYLRHAWSAAFLVAAVLTALLAAVVYPWNARGFLAAGFGLRSYWLYVPMAFVFAATFDLDGLRRFLRLNLALSVPYAMLVVAQLQLGASHWLSRGIDADAPVVGVALDVIRPYGLFTYTGQNVTFCALLVACAVAAWLLPHRAAIGPWLRTLGTLGALVAAAVTGSRAIYFLVGTIGLACLGGLVASRAGALRVRAMTLAIFVTIAPLFILAAAFPHAYEAFLIRFEGAGGVREGLVDRAVGIALGMFAGVDEAPVAGIGPGAASSTVQRLLPPPVRPENELERMNWELGPVFGPLFGLGRLAFAAWLLVTTLAAARRGNMLGLPFAGLAAVWIQSGQITYSTLGGYMAWLSAGLAMAAALRLGGLEQGGAACVLRSSPAIRSSIRPRSSVILPVLRMSRSFSRPALRHAIKRQQGSEWSSIGT